MGLITNPYDKRVLLSRVTAGSRAALAVHVLDVQQKRKPGMWQIIVTERMGGGRVGRTIAVGLSLAAIGACAGEAPAPRVERRDSAGIAIVESFAPQWDAGKSWVLGSVPVLELSGVGPSYDFFGVRDATVLADGRLVVLDDGSHQVRFFDHDGVFLHAMGREGEGPGDFPRALGRRALV